MDESDKFLRQDDQADPSWTPWHTRRCKRSRPAPRNGSSAPPPTGERCSGWRAPWCSWATQTLPECSFRASLHDSGRRTQWDRCSCRIPTRRLAGRLARWTKIGRVAKFVNVLRIKPKTCCVSDLPRTRLTSYRIAGEHRSALENQRGWERREQVRIGNGALQRWNRSCLDDGPSSRLGAPLAWELVVEIAEQLGGLGDDHSWINASFSTKKSTIIFHKPVLLSNRGLVLFP